jgi:hypothetical protein
MSTTTHVVTEDRRPEIERTIRALPAMLAGRVPDEHGIAAGFRARLAWTFFSLVAPAFNAKGRGETDDAGESWHPLSPAYLAYQRPVTGRKPPHAGGLAPGGKDGYLTPELLRLWRRTYADRLAWFIMRMPDKDAASRAAAIAWIVVKKAGAKTKIGTFGERKAGVDYQILVDTGLLRRSILPGELVNEQQVDSQYRPPEAQECNDQGHRLIVGTTVPYAKYHHHAKDPKRRRRLWPERFPADWWRQINSVAVSGFARLGELFGGTRT